MSNENIKKIKHIKISDTNYEIDVSDKLKDTSPTLDSNNVVTSGGVKAALTELEGIVDTKLPSSPHENFPLIDSQGKISAHYLHDAILGQMKFGGIITPYESNDGQLERLWVDTSDLLNCALIEAGAGEEETGEWTIVTTTQAPTLYENRMGSSFVVPEGFYFIVNGNVSKELVSTTTALTDIADDFVTGDWLVAVGNAGSFDNPDNNDYSAHCFKVDE